MTATAATTTAVTGTKARDTIEKATGYPLSMEGPRFFI